MFFYWVHDVNYVSLFTRIKKYMTDLHAYNITKCFVTSNYILPNKIIIIKLIINT